MRVILRELHAFTRVIANRVSFSCESVRLTGRKVTIPSCLFQKTVGKPQLMSYSVTVYHYPLHFCEKAMLVSEVIFSRFFGLFIGSGCQKFLWHSLTIEIQSLLVKWRVKEVLHRVSLSVFFFSWQFDDRNRTFNETKG